MKFLPEFKKYLFSQKTPSSKTTVKNYISDILRFIRWSEDRFNSFSPELITPQIVEQFKDSNNLSARSTERNLSSLRKFFNFLVLEGVISESPFKQPNSGITEQSDPYKLKAFKDYLYVYNASNLTIKNYLMDIKAFLKWTNEVTRSNDAYDIGEKDILGKIDNNLLEEYKKRLPYAPRTINRKLSSLRKYLKWAREEGLLPQIQNLEFKSQNFRSQDRKLDLNLKVKIPEIKQSTIHHSPPIINHYSSFPPLRLIQKSIKGIIYLPEFLLIAPLALITKNISLVIWKLRGKPIFEAVKRKSIKIKSLPKETFAPFAISVERLPLHKRLLFHLIHSRPNWYKNYHSYSLTHYLHLAVLIVFTSAVGFGVYQSFSQNPHQQSVLGTNLMNQPVPRILSFQGRLTDNSNNPITSTTNLRFSIYDADTASGSALKWQEIDTVTPDSDGIFSVLLGKNSTINQDLFANHAGLWLGVTVGQTAELTPRQQLATVAYAENSETLQGLPPITQTGAATSNVVLALDSSGNLTIGGSATPTFQATGGQFTLSGNTLALTTTAGTNGDIVATPSGLGKIDLNKPIQNTSNNNNVTTATGAVEVDDLLAILATSSGQSAFTINQNSTGPLISASSSGTAKFTVDGSGNTTIAGGNFSQTGSGTFSTGTGTISLGGDTTIASGKNFTVTSGVTSLTSTTATGNALSLTDTALTTGTGFSKTLTSNAGNGQTTTGESIALTDSTTAGGGYTALSISTSGSGTGSGNKYLLDLKPAGDSTKEVVFDSSGALRPTVAVSTNTVTLGSSSFYWKNVFADQVTANTIAGTVSGGSTSSTSWTIGSTQTGDVNEALIFQRNSGSGNATLQWNAGAGDLRYLTANYPLNTTYTVNNSSIGTTIDLLSANLTNNTTSGTQNLLSLTNTGTGTTANGIYLNNTGTATNGIQLVGAWGTGILTNNNSINAGTGALTSGAITTSGNFSQTGSTTFSTGGGNVSLNGNTTVAANATLSLASGTGTITQNYSNTSGTGTTLNITDSSATGTTTINGLGIALTGTANSTGSNTINAINLSNVTAIASNTFNGLNFGTGYTNLVNSANWTVTAAGAETLGSTLSVTGATTLTGALTANGGITDTGNFSQTGATTLSTGTGAVSLNGATTITSPSSTTVPVTITGATSQSADLLDIKNSLASVIAKVDSLGNITGNTLTSTVATGTAPLTVTSTTQVANLNASAAQEPNPNLVLNSDFSRRNSWMTFMPETFADTNGWTLQSGTSIGSVSGNVLTAGNTGTWMISAGLSTWRDARFSAQGKLTESSGNYIAVVKYADANDYVFCDIEGSPNNRILLVKVIGGTTTILQNTSYSPTLNNWYWMELESQGTTYICKWYSSGTSPVAKSSATLIATSTNTISDSAVTSGSIGLRSTFSTNASQWGGLSTGNGGVYVEGWGPESWTPTYGGTLGGQAIGFDETADVGPIGKQWTMRAYIPATSRTITLTQDQSAATGRVIPSTAYSLSQYVDHSGLGGSGTMTRLQFTEYNSAGTAGTVTNVDDAAETSWTRKTGSVTTSSTTQGFKVAELINPSSTRTGTSFFDLPQIEQGSIVTPWRNAPGDFSDLVWDLEHKSISGTLALTNTASLAEVNPRDLAINAFLPYDMTVRIDIASSTVSKDSGSTTLYALPGVDGNGGAQQYVIKKVVTTSLESQAGSWTTELAVGKHRITFQAIVDAATVTLASSNNGTRMIITATPNKGVSNLNANDLAEEYSVTDPTIEAGDVVRISGNQGSLGSASVERTDRGYDPSALGVISTAPAITFGNYDPLTGKIIDTSRNRWTTGTDRRPVALSGRVPVKVTNENGDIHRGDTLTSSDKYPGYAMKATRAGRSIGIAMEDFTPSAEGNNTNNYQSQISNVQFGKIMTFVNLSWYDPDVYLTSTGDFVINKVQTTTQVASATPDSQTGLYPSPTASGSAQPTASNATTASEPIANCQTTTDSSNFGLITSSCPQTESTNYVYQITDSLGNVVQRVGVFSEAVIGSLRTGLVQTKDLIVDNITVNNSIVSPLADVQKIQTDVITPLSSNKVVIKLDDKLLAPSSSASSSGTATSSGTPRLEIQNASGSAVASINDKGDASFSGRLTTSTASISGNLSANSATISGTLRTKNLVADNIDTQILNLKSQLSNLIPTNASNSAKPIDIASYSAQLASVDTLQAQVGTFMQGLFAVGPTSLSDATVFGQLSVGGNLILADSSINVLGSDLKLQPLGQGGILLGKKITIDADGNLNTSGDARFNGNLFANMISPIPGQDLVFRLLNNNASSSANFVIQNASGSAIAKIDSNGDATFRKLNLNLVSPAFALSQTEILATGSAGIATISAQQKEITVDNKLVTDKSLIYISPVGTPSAQTLFLLRQIPEQSFTVGSETPSIKDQTFNWLIIN